MLSITKCKTILNKNGISYTDEEILMIRNVVYKFAEVAQNIIEKEKRLTIISDELTNNNGSVNPYSKNMKQ